MKLIKARVKTGARENSIKEIETGLFEVKVKALPEKGKANALIIKLIAKHFGVPQSDVSIKSGGTSKNKLIKLG